MRGSLIPPERARVRDPTGFLMYQHSVSVVTLRDTAGQLIEWPPVSAGPARRAADAAFGGGGAGDRALPLTVVSCLRRCSGELRDGAPRPLLGERHIQAAGRRSPDAGTGVHSFVAALAGPGSAPRADRPGTPRVDVVSKGHRVVLLRQALTPGPHRRQGDNRAGWVRLGLIRQKSADAPA